MSNHFGLSWISDEDLVEQVQHLLNVAKNANLSTKTFEKNVIDPFSSIFEMAGFGVGFNDWVKNESIRQAQKSLQNHVGAFHQRILGKVDGWQDLGTGSEVDLINNKKKIIAEIKNKYNTVSGGKLADQYRSLELLVQQKASKFYQYTSYFVKIIPKDKLRYNRPFVPSDKAQGKKCPSNELIREIDGASFYHLVTGEKYALRELFIALPNVVKETSYSKISNSDFTQLLSFFDAAFD
jgi:hypothetical protein